MMICQTVPEAVEASEQAKRDGLHGLYPSAAIILAEEVSRLRSALETIAMPKRGEPESYWNVEQIGNFAAESLASPRRPTPRAVDRG